VLCAQKIMLSKDCLERVVQMDDSMNIAMP
jgi:hypothetical protein